MNAQVVLHKGKTINYANGLLVPAENSAASVLVYKVYSGSELILDVDTSLYNCLLGIYADKIPEQYVYTYEYELEQKWTVFSEVINVTEQISKDKKIVFDKTQFIRLCFQRKDFSAFDESDIKYFENIRIVNPASSREIERRKESAYLNRADVQAEIWESARKVQSIKNEKASHINSVIHFTLLTDTHYTINCPWQNTVNSIRAVGSGDAIVHLGDFHDGILDKNYCAQFTKKVYDDLFSLNPNLYVTIGNHDANYFKGNPDALDFEEQGEMYLSKLPKNVVKENPVWYYVDFSAQRLRCLFLHSFDKNQQNRYGFSEEEVEWMKKTLASTPAGYKVIVFSHDAPLTGLDYWAKEIRNGEQMMAAMEDWHKNNGYRIMAYIHGHTHADYIYNERAFPIISVGCSKPEYFTVYKPSGSVTYPRILGEASEQLWESMVVDTAAGTIDFVRFGAGKDRRVTKADYDQNKEERVKEKYPVKVWAHRGASGYAPENTIPAFQKAIEMNADGIELDVQLTKDREVVVAHDETINRVSNGQGRIVDFTLAQLKEFNFNKPHPEYEFAAIPTLKEVLELLKPTDLTLNIEFKTGVIFYEGIEKKVVDLVQEYGMQDRVIYSSFNHLSVLKVKELNRSAKTAFLYTDGINIIDYALDSKVDAIHPPVNRLNDLYLVDNAHKNGLQVNVWTVNTKEQMKELCDKGVDSIITNFPDVAYKVVNKQPIEEPPPMQQQAPEPVAQLKKRNPFIHFLGVCYGKVRKLFMKIDSWIMRLAGK